LLGEFGGVSAPWREKGKGVFRFPQKRGLSREGGKGGGLAREEKKAPFDIVAQEGKKERIKNVK